MSNTDAALRVVHNTGVYPHRMRYVCDVLQDDALRLRTSPTPRNAGRMLLTHVITPDGDQRVYFTRVNSVISYFDEDEDGNVIAHVEYGEFACPYNRGEEKLKAMEQAMFAEAARRLNISSDQVERRPLDDIIAVCDPNLKEVPTWSGSTRNATRGRR